MRKNLGSQTVCFQMNSATDGSAVTTGTPTVYYTIDGGTQGSGAGASTHEGNGCWSYVPAQAETNGAHVAFTMVLAAAISQTVNVWPVAYDPGDVGDLGLTALTGHTPQTGDSFARIGAAGASLTDLGGMSTAMKAEVQQEATDALTAYDPPTNAEMEARTILAASYFDPAADTVANVTNVATMSGTIQTLDALDTAQDTQHGLTRTDISNLNDPTAASVATSVLTTQMTEAYAADGVAPTLAQALFAIQQFLQEKSIVTDTMTIKKIDGSTAAMTFTLSDATSPTSITRAT